MGAPTILVTMPTDGSVTDARVSWIWYTPHGPHGVYRVEWCTPWPTTGGM